MEFLYKIFSTLFFQETIIFTTSTLLYFYFFLFYNQNNKNYFLKIVIFIIPTLNIFYHYSIIPEYIQSLGQDSFMETKADFAEALFYIKTLFVFLFDFEIFLRNRFWLVFISAIFSGFISFFIYKTFIKKIKFLNNIFNYNFFNKLFLFSLTIVFLNGSYLVYKNLQIGAELRNTSNTADKKFNDNLKNIKSTRSSKDDLLLVTYIGESTSALNFNLYGYPFKTTPWLNTKKKDKKFVYFKNTFARYTHTTPSLIDTLSVCTNVNKNYCSNVNFTEFNFIPLTKILDQELISTHLFSTQGSLGGHNLANKIVLNTQNKKYNSKKQNILRGNKAVSETKDRAFFKNTYCKNEDVFKQGNSNAVFLHSYAGHGAYSGYLKHITKKEKFIYPDYINPINLLGRDKKNFKIVQEYDTAINYIDGTLKEVVECSLKQSNKNNKPFIFIYFADHGESPSTSRGHDSSIATYEMLHVPFFIYFNDLAYEKYKEKFDFLSSLKEENLSLKIVSDIFLYLFDLEISSKNNNSLNIKKDSFTNIKTPFLNERMMVNKEIERIPTFWSNVENKKSLVNLDKNVFKNQDMSLTLWQLHNYLKLNNLSNKKLIKNLVCQHRANSLILQYKNSMSNGCFETDIYYLKNKVISAHSLEADSSFIFDNFLESTYQKNTVWMDSKNLNKNKNCQFALQWYKKNAKKFISILVELPTSSIENIYNNNIDWINCIKEIDSIENIEVAYYIDINLLGKCSTIVKKDTTKKKNIICNEDLLKKININSIAYDYKMGKEAVLNSSNFKNYKWHVWNVDNLSDFQSLTQRDNMGIILLKNNQSLKNLN
jgi:glucan phosphoethanolaminetransferase (alkaline phosphatase superfamily)